MTASQPKKINSSSESFNYNIVTYFVGFGIRFFLFQFQSIAESLEQRVEISTPTTSWKKAVEGVHLWNQGIDPYDSDIFHESPLGLVAYKYILTNFNHKLDIVFPLCDTITAYLLAWTAHIYLKKQHQQQTTTKHHQNVTSILLSNQHLQSLPYYVSVVYLFCPYAILSCVGKSTATFYNLLLSLFLFLTVSGNWILAPIILALLSSQTFYHVFSLLPLAMFVYQENGKNKVFKVSLVITLFITSVVLLLSAFIVMTGSTKFVSSTYFFIISAPDLTPNIGLFWYFFTEMFDHFRVFFLWIFQVNMFIYVTPVAIRFRKDPLFFLFIYIVLITIFKSYPCIGDVAFYLTLLPIWSPLFCLMRQRLIICCILGSCTLLGPTLWHLWIYSGSANANFFFGITLAFNTGQVFLLTDLLSAYIKREYYLKYGIKYNQDGTLPLMRLQ